MDLGFRGEVADFYQRFRRGYPDEVVDALVASFGLTARDAVLDLGCGTGQLAVPLAGRVRAVLGMDPEPDMLVRARRAAADQGVTTASWLVGSDTDVPALEALLGPASLGAVVIGQALHWMDHDTLFGATRPLLRPGGGVAVVTNGQPLWQQDAAWSRALRTCLEQWLGTSTGRTCGTDRDSQRRYRESLAEHGFSVRESVVEYSDDLDAERITGCVLSALPVSALPTPDDRPAFAAMIDRALEPHAPFTEHVRVTVLTGTR